MGWGASLLFLIGGYFISAVLVAAPSFSPLSQIPLELRSPGVSPWATGRDQVFRKTLDFSSVRLQATGGAYRVQLTGAKRVFWAGMPNLPVSVLKIPIPAGKRGRIILQNLKVEVSNESVPLTVTPRPLVWEPLHRFEIYSEPKTAYFPGRFYQVSETPRELILQVYPIQFERSTKRMLWLRSADLLVQWSDTTEELNVPYLWGNPAIILTSEKLLEGARLLQKFHEQHLGIKSDIVTVERIEKSETEIDEEQLPYGYKEQSLREGVVIPYDPGKKTGYHYSLAKKIIRFLQAKMNPSSPLKYVTLLGDSTLVPPSYYFGVRMGFGSELGVTDQCYAARNHCLEPYFTIGRLPFSSTEEVRNYLAKARRWLDLAPRAPVELSLYGGKAFPEQVYVGELGVLKPLEIEGASWRGVKKYFRTKKNFTRESVLDLVTGKSQSAFAYYLDHGTGNRLYVEHQYVTSREVLDAPASDTALPPFIVSISCTNGAFDNELLTDPLFSGSTDGDQSVGEAMLRTKAGAVAYLGSARPAMGSPLYEVDKQGNLNLTATDYGLQLLDTFYEKYHRERRGRLGDIAFAMYQSYLKESGNDLSDDRHLWTYFNATLLGDPVLPLPERARTDRAYGLAVSTTRSSQSEFSVFPSFPLGEGNDVTLNFRSASEVFTSLLKAGEVGMPQTDSFLDERAFQSGDSHVTAKLSSSDNGGNYFFRIENTQGVPQERQVWFSVE